MRRPTAALLFAVLIGVACDSKADEHVSLTPAPAQSLELAFEATRALALSDHAADAFTVVERYNWEVSRMRLDGSVTASWGRQGQGPGEFKAVTDAVTAEDGATWIFDTSRLAAMAFDSAGAFLDEVRVNGLPVALRGTERGFAGIFFTNPGLRTCRCRSRPMIQRSSLSSFGILRASRSRCPPCLAELGCRTPSSFSPPVAAAVSS